MLHNALYNIFNEALAVIHKPDVELVPFPAGDADAFELTLTGIDGESVELFMFDGKIFVVDAHGLVELTI